MNAADEIRRLKERLDNQISLREFGAVMDGASDDLPRIQAMITTLGALSVTLLVSGPCYVSGNVTIPANVLVRFEGGGAFTGPGVVTYTPWTLPVGAVGAAQLANLSVTSGKIANGAVGATQLDPALKLTGAVAALCHTGNGSAITLPSGVDVRWNFDQVDYDPGGMVTNHGAGSTTWTCTVPSAGLYHVSAIVSTIVSGTTGWAALALFKNAGLYAQTVLTAPANGAGYVAVPLNIDLILAANDYLYLTMNQGTGASQTGQGNIYHNLFAIHRVLGY